jgi:hypothetical protein
MERNTGNLDFKKIISDHGWFSSEFVIQSVRDAWMFFVINLEVKFYKNDLKNKHVPYLPSIGSGSMQLLKDRGLNTALDLYNLSDQGRFLSVPTFGPAKTAILNAWFKSEQATSREKLDSLKNEFFVVLKGFDDWQEKMVSNFKKNNSTYIPGASIQVSFPELYANVLLLIEKSQESARKNGLQFPDKDTFFEKCRELCSSKVKLKYNQEREVEEAARKAPDNKIILRFVVVILILVFLFIVVGR